MSVSSVAVRATPIQVFDVLLDASAYPGWVVGAKRIRGVDPDWPAVGSRFHHEVGPPGPSVEDSSKVLVNEPPCRLVLEVRFRPVGVAEVSIEVEPLGPDRSAVTLSEQPVRGPAAALWSRPLDLLVDLRNRVSLWRLRRMVEQRASRAGPT